MSHSYSLGASVTGTSDVGGLVGWHNHQGRTISHSFSTSEVSGSDVHSVGGLVGASAEHGMADTSYWDTQISGLTYSAGGNGVHRCRMKCGSKSRSMVGILMTYGPSGKELMYLT